MLKNIISNEIILKVVEKEIPIMIKKDGFEIEGFYKSGSIHLKPNEDGTFTSHSRYKQEDFIESFDDLVYLNYEWWKSSKERSEGWKNPDEKWGTEMVRLGLVRREEKPVVNYY